MRINFLVNYVEGGWKPTDVRLGGTERGVVEWAQELVKRGHEVTIYDNDTRGTYEGNGDVCINVKSPEIEPEEPTIFYTNDVDADKQDLSRYDCVINISNWQRDNTPVNNPNVFVVPHGYDDTQIMPSPKVPKQCIYTSSPDRGLDTLLRAWPAVVRAHPDATLLVTYGADGPEYEGIEYLGNLPEEEMDELYRSSDIWCHPANGGELQCIAGLKAQAAACWPVYIPTMALSETVHYGTKATAEDYANKLIEAINGHPMQFYKGTTIRESTDKLLEVIEWTLDGYNSRDSTS